MTIYVSNILTITTKCVPPAKSDGQNDLSGADEAASPLHACLISGGTLLNPSNPPAVEV